MPSFLDNPNIGKPEPHNQIAAHENQLRHGADSARHHDCLDSRHVHSAASVNYRAPGETLLVACVGDQEAAADKAGSRI